MAVKCVQIDVSARKNPSPEINTKQRLIFGLAIKSAKMKSYNYLLRITNGSPELGEVWSKRPQYFIE